MVWPGKGIQKAVCIWFGSRVVVGSLKKDVYWACGWALWDGGGKGDSRVLALDPLD